MKLSKADFLRQFGNQRVATSGLTSGSAINTDLGEKLSRADANSDGIIAGQEEMGRLFDWMAFTNRQHNPNQGFGQELDLKSAPQGLWDVMIETTGGRAGQPAQPVRTTQPAQPTQPVRTTTNVVPNGVRRNINHNPTTRHTTTTTTPHTQHTPTIPPHVHILIHTHTTAAWPIRMLMHTTTVSGMSPITLPITHTEHPQPRRQQGQVPILPKKHSCERW